MRNLYSSQKRKQGRARESKRNKGEEMEKGDERGRTVCFRKGMCHAERSRLVPTEHKQEPVH